MYRARCHSQRLCGTEVSGLRDETKKQIEANGEDKYQTAKETVKPEENQALYYTLTSVKEGSPSGEIRESMLEFASTVIGNPMCGVVQA